MPKDSFFNVKRQSKYFINDMGIATKYELKFDKDGMPVIGEDGEYEIKKRYDNSGVEIKSDYFGNWTDHHLERKDDGTEIPESRKDIQYTQIPRIFKLSKKKFDDACNSGKINTYWCTQKKKILVVDPDDPSSYLDTGKVSTNRLIDQYDNIIGSVGSLADDDERRRKMGGVKLEENDIQNAKKYAFAKLCLSKGYMYYTDPITLKPKCEFNKLKCEETRKQFSDAKPDPTTGLPEKYKYAEWRDDSGCIQVNEANRLFCEGDHLCSTGKGRFNYNDKTGECKLTEEYCNQFQLTYDPKRGNGKNGQCTTKEGQRFGETLGGQALTRGTKCPDKTEFYNTFRNNNLMEQWPNDSMQKITES